jgi:hypothetical protein
MIDQDELYAGVLHGNCNHTGYSEFDNLTGYVTKEYTTEWVDPSGTRWRKRCQIINLGRPDRGIVVDPEEAIADEGIDPDGEPRKRRKMQRRTLDLTLKMNDLLQVKPMTAREMAQALDIPIRRMDGYLRDHGSSYAVVGKTMNEFVYGMPGVVYKDAHLGRMDKVRAHLREHGPSTIGQMIAALGIMKTTLVQHMQKHEGTVYTRLGGKKRRDGWLWGLKAAA